MGIYSHHVVQITWARDQNVAKGSYITYPPPMLRDSKYYIVYTTKYQTL